MNNVPTMAGQETACEAARQPKHIEIDNAINRLESVVGHALTLLDSIQGPIPQDPTCGNKRDTPTFSEVLNNSPQRIDEISEKVHDVLNRIEQELF